MRYLLLLPPEWAESMLIDDEVALVTQALIQNWGQRPIPATAFFQTEAQRDRLLAIGWLIKASDVEVSNG